MKKNFEYLLGDSNPEAMRLRRQSQLWDPVSCAFFDRLKIRKDWKILEIGPGQGSLHLELRKRVKKGRVDAIERSHLFAKNLERMCESKNLKNGTIFEADLFELELPSNSYDLVFVRWVFLFLPMPLKVLKKIRKLLKPGGMIAIQDYHRETLAMIPSPTEWADFMAADRSFFASQGGNASIGSQLPNLLVDAGFKLIDIKAHTKTGHPGSPEWNWLSDYFLGVMPRYGTLKPFSKKSARSLSKKWIAASRKRHSLLIGPTVLDILAKW